MDIDKLKEEARRELEEFQSTGKGLSAEERERLVSYLSKQMNLPISSLSPPSSDPSSSSISSSSSPPPSDSAEPPLSSPSLPSPSHSSSPSSSVSVSSQESSTPSLLSLPLPEELLALPSFTPSPQREESLLSFVESTLTDPVVSHALQLDLSIRNNVLHELLKRVENVALTSIRSYSNLGEWDLFQELASLSLPSFFNQFTGVLNQIKSSSAGSSLDLDFYSSEFRSFLESLTKKYEKPPFTSTEQGPTLHFSSLSREDLLYLDALRLRLFREWKAQLLREWDAYFLRLLDEARAAYLKELYEHIDKYLKLRKVLGPFLGSPGRLWDLSSGKWKAIGFDVLQYYHQLMEASPKIQELANELGRLAQAERELVLEKSKVEKVVTTYAFTHHGKSELVSIHESDELAHVIPQELAHLIDPTLELLFYYKFAEKKLLTYELVTKEGKTISQILEQDEQRDFEKKGPIILCVDTSGSMHGVPERVAKTLAFAISRIALRENRACYFIAFSTAIKTFDIRSLDSLPVLVEFLTFSFHGGTDVTLALEHALELLETEQYKRADVLVISDFIMDTLDEPLIEQILKAKEELKTRFHSLIISSTANLSVLDIFDNNWVYLTTEENPYLSLLPNVHSI